MLSICYNLHMLIIMVQYNCSSAINYILYHVVYIELQCFFTF